MSFLKKLLILLLVAFVVQRFFEVWFFDNILLSLGLLSPQSLLTGQLWRLFTYALFHADFWHLLCNSFLIVVVGIPLERTFGSRCLWKLSFMAIIGAGLSWSLLNPHPYASLIGASGLACGLLSFYCCSFPNQNITLMLWLLVPIRLTPKRLLQGTWVLEILSYYFYERTGLSTAASSAHLGGLAAGMIYFWFLKKKDQRKPLERQPFKIDFRHIQPPGSRFPFSSKKSKWQYYLVFFSLLVVPSFGTFPALEITPKVRSETIYLLKLLDTLHFNGKDKSILQGDELIYRFFELLDDQKLIFHQSDLDEFLKKYGFSFDIYLSIGSLKPAFEIFDRYRTRRKHYLNSVQEQLKGHFSFDQSEFLEIDRKKAPWLQSDEEARALYKKYLSFEICNELLNFSAGGGSVASQIVMLEKFLAMELPSFFLRQSLSLSQKNEITWGYFRNLAPYSLAFVDYFFKEKPYELWVEANREIFIDLIKINLSHRYERDFQDLFQVTTEQVQSLFLGVITQCYDPHSSFLSKEDMEDFSTGIYNNLIGIGAYLEIKNGYCIINGFLPGGPAGRSQQLFPGDRILAVAEEGKTPVDIQGMKLRDSVRLIRGPKNTAVYLTIQSPGQDFSARKVVKIIREEIKLAESMAKAKLFTVPLDGIKQCRVGVIELPSFYGSLNEDKSNVSYDVAELVAKLKKEGMQFLILDLRRNGGGLLVEAVRLAGLFITEGPVVQIKTTGGLIIEKIDSDSSVVWNGPMIIMTSRQTASASEIVAGALQQYGRALLVGDSSTHGKGTVQAVIDMANFNLFSLQPSTLGSAKITIQKFYLPDGSSTQLKGVPSDIVLPSILEYLPIGEADLPHALAWEKIAPISWDYKSTYSTFEYPVTQELIEKLRNKSLFRQNTLPEFEFLKKRIEFFKEKQKMKFVSLNLETRRHQKRSDMLFKKESDSELSRFGALSFPSQSIYLDLVLQQIKKDKVEQELSDELIEESYPSYGFGERGHYFDLYLTETLRIAADWIRG